MASTLPLRGFKNQLIISLRWWKPVITMSIIISANSSLSVWLACESPVSKKKKTFQDWCNYRCFCFENKIVLYRSHILQDNLGCKKYRNSSSQRPDHDIHTMQFHEHQWVHLGSLRVYIPVRSIVHQRISPWAQNKIFALPPLQRQSFMFMTCWLHHDQFDALSYFTTWI